MNAGNDGPWKSGVLFVALLVMTSSMVACGEDDAGSGRQTEPAMNNDGNETGATSATASQPASGERGGTFTVGEETWTIVPSISCSIYPGNIVNIAGHAAEDQELEIVIDWGGPNQARVAKSDAGQGWHAIRDTLQIEVDGRMVRGSATFSEYFGGAGETAEGTFEVQC